MNPPAGSTSTIEIRSLILLSENRTIILSTHNLPEVMETCDRLIVIHHGEIVADGTAQELEEREATNPQVFLTVRGDASREQLEEAIAPLAEWERFIALRVPTSAGRPKLKRKDRKTFVRLCFALQNRNGNWWNSSGRPRFRRHLRKLTQQPRRSHACHLTIANGILQLLQFPIAYIAITVF